MSASIQASGRRAEAPPILFHLWRDANERWQVQQGQPEGVTESFVDLSSALAFANSSCQGAAATIELRVGTFYAVIHQDQGWPQRICGPGRT